MTRLVIRGARLLGADAADLLVDDGVITEVGSVSAPRDAEVLDADGLVALPGLVDLHVHLREPGREDAETIATGSAAAAAGGFTAVFAMANTSPVTDTAEAAERVLDLGRACGLTEVVPVGAVTKGLEGAELAELGLMARSRAKVRVFSDDGHCVHDARIMRRALEYVKPFGGVISQHAQDPRLAGREACCHEGEVSGRLGLPGWPGIAEESIVARDVMLARHTGSRVHVAHVSTAGTVEVIRWAKAQGIAVTAEVTPHHLALTTDLLVGYDPVYKVNPPLRPTEDVEALRAAPRRRHHRRRRDRPRAARAARQGARLRRRGVRHARPRDGPRRSSATSWSARACSTGPTSPGSCRARPARIGGLADQGSALAVGSPAHITLVDPDREVTVDAAASRSRSRNNPWHGRTLRGAVLATVHAGRVTHDVRNGADTRRELTNARPRELTCDHPDTADRAEPRQPAPARASRRSSSSRTAAPSAAASYGAVGETVGEAVFSTGMTGYQETLTDPSYHRQVIVMTAPHVGNTGINTEDDESTRIWVAGYVVRDPAIRSSNWRATRELEDELVDQGVVGICDIDTRALTRHLRERGAMRVGIFSGDAADRSRRRAARRGPHEPRRWPAPRSPRRSPPPSRMPSPPVGEKRFTVAAIDLGIKAMTPAAHGRARHRGARAARHRDASTTSSRWGSPARTGSSSPTAPVTRRRPSTRSALLREVLDRGIPFFGICFGNQLLGRALGFGTYKLKYGHRGINQPVMDRTTGKVEVTAHNHGFAVDAPLDQDSDTAYGRVRVSHVCLNDDVVEGLECLDLPAYSVQYHPEAAAGPHDAAYLFDRFVELMTTRQTDHQKQGASA